MTRSQVARRLAVSPNTVSRWAREGRLPCTMTLGGHRRFARSVIDEIAKAATQTSVSPDELETSD